MFTNIRMKNFMSFKDININLMGRNDEVKKLAIIYGENGSGKTNIVEAFKFLYDSIVDSSLIDKSMDIKPEYSGKTYIRNVGQRINATNPMELAFDFIAKDNSNGSYFIAINDNRVVEEKLSYKINKNKGVHFHIKPEEKIYDLSKSIFTDTSYKNILDSRVEMYWGLNSFLSIMFKEYNTVNKEFMNKVVNNNFKDALYTIINQSRNYFMINDFSEKSFSTMFDQFEILPDLDRGEISASLLMVLDKSEGFVNDYLKSINSDIIRAYYKSSISQELVMYELWIKKVVGDQVIDIPFSAESTGTRQLLNLLRPLLLVMTNKDSVVIIDEADTGIHDLLFKDIIMAVKDNIKGQLILTTHSTILMEAFQETEDHQYIYMIRVDAERDKKVLAINEYNERTYKKNNVRTKYMKGDYGGIPYTGPLKFEELSKRWSDARTE